jgi:hypothetical protein
MDAETLDVLRLSAAIEAGLPDQLRGRLTGDTIAALRTDAQALATDLGYAESRAAGGSFSDRIRAAAGRVPAEPVAQPAGIVGVGRGGSATPRQAQPVDMNAVIRGTISARRTIEHRLAEAAFDG